MWQRLMFNGAEKPESKTEVVVSAMVAKFQSKLRAASSSGIASDTFIASATRVHKPMYSVPDVAGMFDAMADEDDT